MTTVSDIRREIDRIAPFNTAEDFDNVGLLVGGDGEVRRCLVTLDVTADAVSEAVEKGCSLILSHHPVIFHAMKRIAADSVPGLLLRNGITVISAHTNVDKALLNDRLAELLGIEKLSELPGSGGCACIALPPEEMTASELAAYCREKLGSGGRVFDSGRPVRKLALCCGGGGSFVYDLPEEADCLVSGDMKHDQVIEAVNRGVSLIDLGHFETERHFVPMMAELLGKTFPDVEFIPAESCMPLFRQF
ncbi:MAG: Nif3-like dinuclear metal center hexameric protein [Oscillospiraceae bacterium]|nr:Nif3-like dinuclear metal center hexameric protein [Oscillospiraceae bacterium]